MCPFCVPISVRCRIQRPWRSSSPVKARRVEAQCPAPGSPSPTDPNPAGYFHASSGQTVTNYGCEAWYNVWDPQVDIPSSPGDDHSISQTWLQNYDKPKTQSLEAGLTVDHSLNGDAANHLFTYYTTNGYAPDADNTGGYNRLVKGWVQVHASIFPGIRINGSSTQGAATQLEIALKYQLYNGNWWLGFNNNESGAWIWLGYYPASLFAGGLVTMLRGRASVGEVYSALPDPCQTTDQMGSGQARFGRVQPCSLPEEHADPVEHGWRHGRFGRLTGDRHGRQQLYRRPVHDSVLHEQRQYLEQLPVFRRPGLGAAKLRPAPPVHAGRQRRPQRR